MFFFNDTATTQIYTLSLHDALPISSRTRGIACGHADRETPPGGRRATTIDVERIWRSEEHTSELQSRQYLVCRLLLEKKKKCDTKITQQITDAEQLHPHLNQLNHN